MHRRRPQRLTRWGRRSCGRTGTLRSRANQWPVPGAASPLHRNLRWERGQSRQNNQCVLSTQVLVAARSPPIPIGAHEQALRTQSRQAAGDDDSQALQSEYHERATEIANLERRASALQQQLQQQRQILQLRQQQEEQKRVPQQRAVQRSV